MGSTKIICLDISLSVATSFYQTFFFAKNTNYNNNIELQKNCIAKQFGSIPEPQKATLKNLEERCLR
jgi:hypothetical protein